MEENKVNMYCIEFSSIQRISINKDIIKIIETGKILTYRQIRILFLLFSLWSNYKYLLLFSIYSVLSINTGTCVYHGLIKFLFFFHFLHDSSFVSYLVDTIGKHWLDFKVEQIWLYSFGIYQLSFKLISLSRICRELIRLLFLSFSLWSNYNCNAFHRFRFTRYYR